VIRRSPIATRPLKAFAAVMFAAGAAGTVVAARVPTQIVIPETNPGLVERFLAPQEQPLVSYRAFRHLTASTRGGKMRGTMDVWTEFDPHRGFRYEVASEEGSELIRHRVLVPALEAERKATGGPDAARMALTRDNYDFTGISSGDRENLMRVDIRPRRKHGMLISGAVFLAGDTADLIRIEGEPTDRPSFWTRKVRIVREYDRVGGVRVPVAMRSTAEVLLVGTSDFAMTYRYELVNGTPIAN
jgi:hypothetical protein